MSRYIKSALVVAVFVAVLTGFGSMRHGGVRPLGSGGLGAMSFGFSEALIEFVVLTGVVWAFLYWKSRRR